jgi:hypothetical protein
MSQLLAESRVCLRPVLQRYFLVNEQYFSLITNQHKPNFSETNREHKPNFSETNRDHPVKLRENGNGKTKVTLPKLA